MHIADAMISVPVGGVLWIAAAGVTAHSAGRVRSDLSEQKVPLMGVLGAFIFAAQMINFTIPGTGASGHLSGGMMLAVLLGPHGAFLTITSVLTVQALFFGDGGLLALGGNVFNIGFLPCLVVYPLIFQRLLANKITQRRLVLASTVAAVVGLQLGAAGVVFQIVLSGVSDLPLKTFLLLMLPIHLAIGLVEGVLTAAVVSFVWKAKPELITPAAAKHKPHAISIKPVLIVFAAAAICTAAVLPWFVSTNPDGLEWAVAHTTGQQEIEPAASNIGTSVPGIVGGGITLLLAGMVGVILKRRAPQR